MPGALRARRPGLRPATAAMRLAFPRLATRLATVLALAALATSAGACSDTSRAKFNALGEPHAVISLSGGVVIGRWVSTGKIESETQSDGWAIRDRKTDRLVRIGGDAILYPLASEAAADSLVQAWGTDYGDLTARLVPPVPGTPRTPRTPASPPTP